MNRSKGNSPGFDGFRPVGHFGSGIGLANGRRAAETLLHRELAGLGGGGGSGGGGGGGGGGRRRRRFRCRRRRSEGAGQIGGVLRFRFRVRGHVLAALQVDFGGRGAVGRFLANHLKTKDKRRKTRASSAFRRGCRIDRVWPPARRPTGLDIGIDIGIVPCDRRRRGPRSRPGGVVCCWSWSGNEGAPERRKKQRRNQ